MSLVAPAFGAAPQPGQLFPRNDEIPLSLSHS